MEKRPLVPPALKQRLSQLDTKFVDPRSDPDIVQDVHDRDPRTLEQRLSQLESRIIDLRSDTEFVQDVHDRDPRMSRMLKMSVEETAECKC
jgi:hypothetical protein